MPAVLQMTRKLEQRPEVPSLPDIALRHFAGPEDIDFWLDLRQRAFARQPVGVRQWDRGDFEREFLDKEWWRPEAMWFAEAVGQADEPRSAVGTVTLAWRGVQPHARPVVHWLAVLPRYRRQGIGNLLLATLEAACWDAGYRQVWLETHAGWAEAARFYEALGYVSAATQSGPSDL